MPASLPTPRLLRFVLAAALITALTACAATPSGQEASTSIDEWPSYAGSAGARYSQRDQITPANVSRLAVAWTYHTGELGQNARDGHKLTFEATPIHFDGRLYFSTAYGHVIALDPVTGNERWRFDAGVDRGGRFSEVTSRGVSAWRDSRAAPDAPCARRIFAATIDARLLALDAATGRPCAGFGTGGTVRLAEGLNVDSPPDYQVTSPPAVLGNLVITGSSIGDNWHADTGSGVVRAFDVRTGAARWGWSPLAGQPGRTGAANAWSVFNVDAARDLVFVPTTSPSPDFFGGLRPGANAHANAIVALRGSTGEMVWAFQTVHHDLWDYDIAAQPVLVDIPREGRLVAAVAQPTKTGWLFVLDRDSGAPLFKVEERAVPPSDIPGEQAWPTQPAAVGLPLLMPHGPLTPETVWGPTPEARAECQRLVAPLRSAGVYTPPSLPGTIMYPGNGSGTNWGSAAFDPMSRRLVLNTSRLATLVQLLPRAQFDRLRAERGGDWEYGAQREAPYGMRRRTLETAQGIPCNPPPWGTLAAVDLGTGTLAWEVPLGHLPDEHPLLSLAGSPPIGTPGGGGPIVTAGGVVFIAGTMDRKLRAFDLQSGREVWQAPLPFAGIATPMTYRGDDGRQFVVIAAGGHGKADLAIGDAVVAFALPPMIDRLRRSPWPELGLFGVAALLMFAYEYLDRVARQEAIDPLVPLIEEGTGVMIAGFLFFAVRRLARSQPVTRPRWAGPLSLHVVALLFYSATHTTANWLSREVLFRMAGLGDYDYGVMAVRYAMELPIDIILYTAIVVGTWTVDRRTAARQTAFDSERLEARLAQARLQNLQLRLHPHFLFNALNTISSVMYQDPVAADTMLARLSELLRHALRTAEVQEVPLAVELEALDHYLALLDARFGADFTCTRTIDATAAAVLVPSLVLQPLVENAVRHGGLAYSGRGRVALQLRRDSDRLVIQVDDDGPGTADDRDVLHEGTGLGATAERLRLLYGADHTVAAGNLEGGGFRVILALPWHESAGSGVEIERPAAGEAVVETASGMLHARAHR